MDNLLFLFILAVIACLLLIIISIFFKQKKSSVPIFPTDIPFTFNCNYPELRESLDEIQKMLDAIRESCLPEINAATKPITPILTWKIQVYMVTAFHRIFDLVNTMLYCWSSSKYSCAFILLKSLNENAAVLYAAAKKISQQIEQRKFNEINVEVNHLLFGNKRKDYFPYLPRNVLTFIDKVARDFSNYRKNYDHLCEYAHPNFDGMMGLYGKLKNINTYHISRVNGINQKNDRNFVYLLRSNLRVAILGFKNLSDQLEAITALSISNLRKQGRDYSGYTE